MIHRPRRLRRTPALRALVREHAVRLDSLVQPIFVVERSQDAGPISSMPGIERFTVDGALAHARELARLGLRSVLLFGIPANKDARGSAAADPNGPVVRAIRAIKDELPEMLLIADVCNCEYTDHGHCGIVDERGDVDNDATLTLLVQAALAYAQAGVDVVAPSDMMDGRVEAIRRALDAQGLHHIAIMAYSAKYASAFYGPFREAAGSSPRFGDRRTYQMDPANAREAIREIDLDIAQGADMVIIKPGLAYLDLVRAARDTFDVPIAVYNVSGEYSMLMAAFANGWLERDRTIDETLLAFVRAGADIIITYFAKEYAQRYAAAGRP